MTGPLLVDLSAGRPGRAREALQLTAAPPGARLTHVERGAKGVLGAVVCTGSCTTMLHGDDVKRATSDVGDSCLPR